MTQETWTAVDRYITELFVPQDPSLDAALQAADAAGLPAINVSPPQGKLLYILARAVRARAILEIGTLAGYSAIWLARALEPGGKLITLEADPKHAQLARANLERAGLGATVQVQLGPALKTLPRLAKQGDGPFDMVFIDANKENTTEYFQWALKLSHPGSVIVTDNVVRKGAVTEADSSDVDVQGVRRFNAAVAAEPRVQGTVIQMVGSKGYDGMTIAIVVA
jgi:predicted O-methyltransferase YrrM